MVDDSWPATESGSEVSLLEEFTILRLFLYYSAKTQRCGWKMRFGRVEARWWMGVEVNQKVKGRGGGSVIT